MIKGTLSLSLPQLYDWRREVYFEYLKVQLWTCMLLVISYPFESTPASRNKTSVGLCFGSKARVHAAIAGKCCACAVWIWHTVWNRWVDFSTEICRYYYLVCLCRLTSCWPKRLSFENGNLYYKLYCLKKEMKIYFCMPSKKYTASVWQRPCCKWISWKIGDVVAFNTE